MNATMRLKALADLIGADEAALLLRRLGMTTKTFGGDWTWLDARIAEKAARTDDWETEQDFDDHQTNASELEITINHRLPKRKRERRRAKSHTTSPEFGYLFFPATDDPSAERAGAAEFADLPSNVIAALNEGAEDAAQQIRLKGAYGTVARLFSSEDDRGVSIEETDADDPFAGVRRYKAQKAAQADADRQAVEAALRQASSGTWADDWLGDGVRADGL